MNKPTSFKKRSTTEERGVEQCQQLVWNMIQRHVLSLRFVLLNMEGNRTFYYMFQREVSVMPTTSLAPSCDEAWHFNGLRQINAVQIF